MRILSWNCRGAGRPPTVRSLKALARKEGPEVFFVTETKAKSPKIDKLKNSMGFSDCFCVESVGKFGGLALFWKAGVELEMIFSNKYSIVALVFSDLSSSPWLQMAIHGPPYLGKKRRFWELMEDIITRFSGVWLMFGDLNCIASSKDKLGGSSRGESSSRCFQNFISNVGAIDLGFCGPKFTWTNKKVGWANIRERLDRGICNVDWQSLFPKAGVKHLTAPNSDHLPILLDTDMEVCSGPRPFRFKAMWVRDDSSKEVVQKAWDIPVEGSLSSKLVQKYQNVRKKLISWNKMVFGFAKTRIQEIEKLIRKIQSLDPSQENLEIEASLNLELNEWLEREEVKWRQKSRELWLREGDRNSKFFTFQL